MLFWTGQNQSCVIFELTSGPSLALGTPVSDEVQDQFYVLRNDLFARDVFQEIALSQF